MKTRTTVVLVILAAVAVAAIWLFEKDLPGTDARREARETLLPDLDADAVTRVRLERPDRPPLVVERDGDAWQVTSPLADRADTAVVLSLLRDLGEARVVTRVPAGDVRGGDEATGLGDGALRVALESGASSATLEIGARDAPGDLRYTRTNGGDELALVRRGLADDLALDVVDVRDRRVADLATLDLARVLIERNGRPVLDLARRDTPARDTWWLTHPLEDVADAGTVTGLLGRVTALTIETFVDADGLGAELDEPWMRIVLERSGDAAASGEIASGGGPADADARDDGDTTGASPSRAPLAIELGDRIDGTSLRLARVSDREALFEIDTSSLEQELDLPPARLRSMTALDASTWDVEQVEIRRGGEALVVERVEGAFDVAEKWRVVEPEGRSFDPAKFDSAVGSLARVRAIRLDDDVSPAAAGLDAPSASVTFRYADRPAATLSIGRAAAEGEVWASREGRDTPLVVPEEDAARIDPSAFAHDAPPASAGDAGSVDPP